MAMSELKRRLLKIELARLGFRNAKYSEEQDVFLVDPADSQTMRISDNGTVLFYALHEYLGHEVREMALRVNEIIAAWENAPAVPFEDISHFRILSEYNNIVLAARDDSELGYGHGLYYVTWRYSYGRTGFEHGNYTEDASCEAAGGGRVEGGSQMQSNVNIMCGYRFPRKISSFIAPLKIKPFFSARRMDA